MLEHATFSHMNTGFGIVVLCTIALSATAMVEGDSTKNEFWVGPTASGAKGIGTRQWPFDGSTQKKFDAVLKRLPPDSTLHILPGTYFTAGIHYSGSANIKSGQKILGSGIDRTIIRLVTKDAWTGILASELGTNMEICDLTCDGNYKYQQGAVTYYGVGLYGTHCAIRRVKVINLTHHLPYSTESFGILIGTMDLAGHGLNGPSTQNVIEACELSGFRGEFCTGIGIFNNGTKTTTPISGVVRNNRVFLPYSGVRQTQAIGGACGYQKNMVITGNYVDGATIGIYADTGAAEDVVIANNTLKNCSGAPIRCTTAVSNITFCFNTLVVNRMIGGAIAIHLVELPKQNIAIIGNSIRIEGKATGAIFMSVADTAGLLAVNNRVAAGVTNRILSSSKLKIRDNVDAGGGFGLPKVKSFGSATRRVVGAGAHMANDSDFYIGVRATSATTITLPPAAKHIGRELVIVKEVGTKNTVSIVPQQPREKVKGADRFNLNAPYGYVMIVSDGTNWVER